MSDDFLFNHLSLHPSTHPFQASLFPTVLSGSSWQTPDGKSKPSAGLSLYGSVSFQVDTHKLQKKTSTRHHDSIPVLLLHLDV